jgi:aminoglycoside 2''-phosphotransferase
MSTDQLASFIEAIRRKYPDLTVRSARLDSHGQNNDVLVINDEFIFRFPRYAEGIKRLAIETTLLAGIQPHVTLSVPGITFENLAAQTVGAAFVGYHLIAGVPLSHENFQAIRDERVMQTFAQQLAGFLKELHQIPVETPLSYQLPIFDTIDECVDIYTRMRDKCFPFMRPDARDWAVHHFESFLNNPHHFEYQLVIRHGDFGTTNILFDPQNQVITGVIDFSNAGLGDPAYDFAGLLSSYGEPFLKRCVSTYPEIESFWSRILFYQGTFALLDALFGLENNDSTAFEQGISKYV